MEDTRWDHGLTVTGEGQGLAGHAGAVLLRKLADQAGLTGALGSALARRGKFPLVDRGVALVSMAVAIALGATSMTDITVDVMMLFGYLNVLSPLIAGLAYIWWGRRVRFCENGVVVAKFAVSSAPIF